MNIVDNDDDGHAISSHCEPHGSSDDPDGSDKLNFDEKTNALARYIVRYVQNYNTLRYYVLKKIKTKTSLT